MDSKSKIKSLLQIETGIQTNESGSSVWRNAKGQKHRDLGPAVENEKVKRWYIAGKLHREDGPAVVFSKGTRRWYQNNLLHRIDGPAVEYQNGRCEYWLDGVRHHLTHENFIQLVAQRKLTK